MSPFSRVLYARWLGFLSHLFLQSVYFCHLSHPIRRLNDLAECCVFVKQSVDPFHCDRLHFELRSKWEVANPKIQAPKKLRSSNSENILAAACFMFGIWCLGFGICTILLNAKWSRHPFFRSYGARLPSSLTRFHSRA